MICLQAKWSALCWNWRVQSFAQHAASCWWRALQRCWYFLTCLTICSICWWHFSVFRTSLPFLLYLTEVQVNIIFVTFFYLEIWFVLYSNFHIFVMLMLYFLWRYNLCILCCFCLLQLCGGTNWINLGLEKTWITGTNEAYMTWQTEMSEALLQEISSSVDLRLFPFFPLFVWPHSSNYADLLLCSRSWRL